MPPTTLLNLKQLPLFSMTTRRCYLYAQHFAIKTKNVIQIYYCVPKDSEK